MKSFFANNPGRLFAVFASVVLVFLGAINCEPSLYFAVIAFVFGELADLMTTYKIGQKVGRQAFANIESNPAVIRLVFKYGFKKGLILSVFHPLMIGTAAVNLLVGGLIYWLARFAIYGSTGIMAGLAAGILYLGIIFLGVSGNNILVAIILSVFGRGNKIEV